LCLFLFFIFIIIIFDVLLSNNSAAAVMVLGAMVKRDPCSQLSQLPRLVETVVKSLDPHTPAMRDACLKATTAVLHMMVTVCVGNESDKS
jgi:hypothetical protein